MRKHILRRAICGLLTAAFFWSFCTQSFAETAGAANTTGNISAYAAVLYEPVSGTVLFEKNSRVFLPVASTTKIMTALLAFESGRTDEPVTITPEAVRTEGSSMGLHAGEVLTLKNLACGMMASSGNDGANAIALHLCGSAEAFSEKMNARAAELGMAQTHFVTPSGLDAEGHGSTAQDMALLAAEAMRCEAFAEAVGQKEISVPFVSPEKTVRYENHNRLLTLYPDCTGIKTGFTKKAGRCLVSSAERDGARLICVTLNAPDDWNDHINLYDYGFAQLEKREYAAERFSVCVPTVGGETEFVSAVPEETYSVLLPKEAAVTVTYFSPRFCYAPIDQGETIGSVRYSANGKVIKEMPLVAKEDCALQKDGRTRLQKLLARFLRRLKTA